MTTTSAHRPHPTAQPAVGSARPPGASGGNHRRRRRRPARDGLEVHFDRRAAVRRGDPASGVVTTVQARGEVDSGNQCALADALACALAGSTTMVVDLHAATFFDSASVAVVLDVAARARAAGVGFHLARPPRSLVRIHGICWPEVPLPVLVRPGAAAGVQRRGVVVCLGVRTARSSGPAPQLTDGRAPGAEASHTTA